MITDYETEVRPTEKRILHVTIALKDYTALLEENKRQKRALGIMWHLWRWAASQSDVNGDAISQPESDAMGIAKEAYETLDIKNEIA